LTNLQLLQALILLLKAIILTSLLLQEPDRYRSDRRNLPRPCRLDNLCSFSCPGPPAQSHRLNNLGLVPSTSGVQYQVDSIPGLLYQVRRSCQPIHHCTGTTIHSTVCQ
ncbi:hypothetical protein BGZ61DRAFT_217675, partial [Ilyonectria robusta]|uniref:uncharacterized protein n=1 Tax=Ilyonectria robusta TaxID=1079257 RepID=UPI001E8DD506